MITCKYGTYNVYYDVTDTVLYNFCKNSKIIIPEKKQFNDLFGDPFFGVIKKLTIQHNNNMYIISEHDTNEHIIDLNTIVDKPLITFIIPTINRPTLINTLESIEQQTDPDWNALCIFDRVDPSEEALAKIKSNPKFRYIVLMEKLGKDTNSAGNVRNAGINTVSTQWIGFVDDDDLITPLYVQRLKEELITSPTIDTIIFRGLWYHNLNYGTNILPPPLATNFYHEQVGITFCYKLKMYRNGIVFIPSKKEDFDLLDRIRTNKYKILMSPKIVYKILNRTAPNNILEYLESISTRVIL
jgi:glycosyltransferase involved in cell wall biosynthesis